MSELPNIIKNQNNSEISYELGKFLGKGGFAKCYEFRQMSDGKVYAGKVVPKTLLSNDLVMEKMDSEIKFHRSFKHKHIVEFIDSFETSDHVYVILEICKYNSMMELHLRRGALTEPEVRYYMKQLCLGIEYLHGQQIIHRDLKLGNIFLDKKMHVKIGDFGLAIKKRKKLRQTVCGTPNYMAPEIVAQKGHGLEVDIWSAGCIFYTLLVGRPPFQTETVKKTYKKIKKGQYIIPEDRCGPSAQHLITSMLHAISTERIKIGDILNHDFFKNGYLPDQLPSSALSVQPSFTASQLEFAKTIRPRLKSEANDLDDEVFFPEPIYMSSLGSPRKRSSDLQNVHLDSLSTILEELCKSYKKLGPTTKMLEECQHPASSANYWISKWVDYSDKFGFGYALSDNSVGIQFNDLSNILLHADGEKIQYFDNSFHETFCSVKNHPSKLKEMVSQVSHCRKFMKENLIEAGSSAARNHGDDISRLPVLQRWFKTGRAICLWLSDGCMQINWFESHEKFIFCPRLGAITELKKDGNTVTYTKDLLLKHGFSTGMNEKILYALHIVKKLKDEPTLGRISI